LTQVNNGYAAEADNAPRSEFFPVALRERQKVIAASVPVIGYIGPDCCTYQSL